MASIEPPQRKHKVEITTTMSPTYYICVDGKYVQVEKPDKYEPSSGWSSEEDDVDPLLEEEYNRQLRESNGFDLNFRIPSGTRYPYDLTNEDLHGEIGIYSRVGLHWYNLRKGSNLQLVRLVKYVTVFRGFGAYSITMEVMEPANDSHFDFQTCVVRVPPCKKGDYKIVTEICRIKPKPESSEDCRWCWDETEIMNDFNNGDLEWLPDDALTKSGEKQKQYYEVQESEIQENDWLNLYTEFAFYAKTGKKNLPLKIKKVVVQTHEDVETSKKLMSGNAIFYISFSGDNGEHRAVVSRITDGDLGHVALEVNVMFRVRDVK